MRSIHFEGHNKLYGKPKNWDDAKDGVCGTLATHVDDAGNILSVWEPSLEERARIAEGENIFLNCYSSQPPVILGTTKLRDPKLPIQRLKRSSIYTRIADALGYLFARKSLADR